MIMNLKLQREKVAHAKSLYRAHRDLFPYSEENSIPTSYREGQLQYYGLFQPVLGAQLMKRL